MVSHSHYAQVSIKQVMEVAVTACEYLISFKTVFWLRTGECVEWVVYVEMVTIIQCLVDF